MMVAYRAVLTLMLTGIVFATPTNDRKWSIVTVELKMNWNSRHAAMKRWKMAGIHFRRLQECQEMAMLVASITAKPFGDGLSDG